MGESSTKSSPGSLPSSGLPSSGLLSSGLLSATEAARRLGIRLPTLYAYVSRGLLRSLPVEGTRRRGYPEVEVERLRRSVRRRRSPRAAARSALDWGLPVLDTSLTLIHDGAFSYRGHDATELARSATLEEVAALLWLEDSRRSTEVFDESLPSLPRAWFEALEGSEDVHPSLRLSLAVQLAAVRDVGALGGGEDARIRRASKILRTVFAAAVGLRRRRRLSLAGLLQESWCPDRPELAQVLDATLVLCADHELNVSSFTARCVASAGASLYEAVSAGLGALRGSRHGGLSDRAEALLREVGVRAGGRAPTRAEVRRSLLSRLQRGEDIPGFGQPLYPEGDPRFPAILEALASASPRSPVLVGVRRLAEEGEELVERRPTLDLGLAAVAAEAGLDPGGAWTLFALGRTAGWIAHALEEFRRGRLIRPRARYVGH